LRHSADKPVTNSFYIQRGGPKLRSVKWVARKLYVWNRHIRAFTPNMIKSFEHETAALSSSGSQSMGGGKMGNSFMQRAIIASFGLMLCLTAGGWMAGGAFAAEQSSISALGRMSSPALTLTPVAEYGHCQNDLSRCREQTYSREEFRECMREAGCFDNYGASYRERRDEPREETSCSTWRDQCALNRPRGSENYFRCLRQHGCD
jgi:hypothetical protein